MSSVKEQFQAAKDAVLDAQKLKNEERAALIKAFAAALEKEVDRIVENNKKDLEKMDLSNPLYDRLLLTGERIKGLVKSLKEVSQLPDPTAQVLFNKILENGLEVQKVTVPLGVIGVIYEARPNVTIDVAALCLRSGNACLLKGGSDAWNSNDALVHIMREVLSTEGVN